MYKKSRQKKVPIFLISAAVFMAALFLIVLVGFNFENIKSLNKYKASEIEIPNNLKIIAQNGYEGNKKNSYVTVKKAHMLGTDGIFLDLNFDEKGLPVLAKNKKDARAENIVTLERVMQFFTEYSNSLLCLKVDQVTNLSAVNDLAKKYELTHRTVYLGVDQDLAAFVKSKNPDFDLYINIEPNKRKINDPDYCYKLLEPASNLGVKGISCKTSSMNETLAEIISESGFELALFSDGKGADHYRALGFSPHFIITDRPSDLFELIKEIRSLE